MTTYIKFEMDVRSWSTGGHDPEDSWSRDSTDGEVSARSAVKVKEDGYDVLGIDADLGVGTVVYLVWAQYSTGDSFGRDGGQYILLDVYTSRDEADAKKEYYNNVKHDGSYGADFPYLPWFGYFESLDYVSVDALVLT